MYVYVHAHIYALCNVFPGILIQTAKQRVELSLYIIVKTSFSAKENPVTLDCVFTGII